MKALAGSPRVLLFVALLAVCANGARAQAPADATPNESAHLCAAQQEAFRAALSAVTPCIVRIDTIGGAMPIEQSDATGEHAAALEFRQADGPTTGVVWSADGYIVTSSFNFVRDPVVITVTTADGRRLVAKLVARDIPGGLTLIRVEATGLPVPQWAPSDTLRAGQWALAAGYGNGTAKPTLTLGVLSALSRLDGRAVQTDAKTSPANYGGPLFDLDGRVIGICVPKAGGAGDPMAGVEWYDSGIGFAIRADYLLQRMERLKAGRDLQRGLLGVLFDPGEPVVGVEGPPPTDGVPIDSVAPGPAADAGLQPDDVITRFNGQPTSRAVALRRAIARTAAGDRVELTYRRGERITTVTLTLAGENELRARRTAAEAEREAPAPQTQP